MPLKYCNRLLVSPFFIFLNPYSRHTGRYSTHPDVCSCCTYNLIVVLRGGPLSSRRFVFETLMLLCYCCCCSCSYCCRCCLAALLLPAFNTTLWACRAADYRLKQHRSPHPTKWPCPHQVTVSPPRRSNWFCGCDSQLSHGLCLAC